MDLRTAREALGWSQLKLDRKAGLTKGTTSDLECGRIRNPSFSVVVAVIDALRAAGLEGLKVEDVFRPRQGDTVSR